MIQWFSALEGRVERLGAKLDDLARQLTQLAQQLAQLWAQQGNRPPAGGTLVRVQVGAGGLAAANPAAPSSNTSSTLMVPTADGVGWTAAGGQTITLYSDWGTAAPGGKYGRAQVRPDGNYDLIVWDC